MFSTTAVLLSVSDDHRRDARNGNAGRPQQRFAHRPKRTGPTERQSKRRQSRIASTRSSSVMLDPPAEPTGDTVQKSTNPSAEEKQQRNHDPHRQQARVHQVQRQRGEEERRTPPKVTGTDQPRNAEGSCSNRKPNTNPVPQTSTALTRIRTNPSAESRERRPDRRDSREEPKNRASNPSFASRMRTRFHGRRSNTAPDERGHSESCGERTVAA